jgi:hypothetical protein
LGEQRFYGARDRGGSAARADTKGEKYTVAKLLASISLIVSLLFGLLGSLPARRGEEVLFKAVLIADIHADANPIRDRMDLLRECFAGIGETEPDADCMVLAGDITNSGDMREYVFLQNIMNAYCRIGTRLPEIGNHDSWHHSDDPDYAVAAQNFKAFCLMNGVLLDRVYYRKDVNGVPFLMTGVEYGDFGDPVISGEQLRWLDRELEDACASGSPVFVVCHKPVESMGALGERLENILLSRAETATAPIILVSGHRHIIGENTFRSPAQGLVYLNLPSLLDTEDGGMGFVAEMTAHEIILTGMNFITGETLPGHTYTVEY